MRRGFGGRAPDFNLDIQHSRSAVALTMLLAGRIKLWHLLIVIPPALLAGLLVRPPRALPLAADDRVPQSLRLPRPRRLPHDPEPAQLLHRRVTGKGLGNGIQKLGYLPEDTTDFIFAVICEELGLFGASSPSPCISASSSSPGRIRQNNARDNLGPPARLRRRIHAKPASRHQHGRRHRKRPHQRSIPCPWSAPAAPA
jgi:hypothetical protein